MDEQFVTYNIAVKLKELGFSEQCLGCYPARIDRNLKILFISTNVNDKQVFEHYETVLAPLWQQAIDWIRKNYHFDIHITFRDTKTNKVEGINSVYYDIEVYHLMGGDAYKVYKFSEISDEYNIAREEGILKTIDILINRQ
jgi:hypothetical protein